MKSFKHCGKELIEENDVQVFSIPGVTLELPSTKGPVRFTPYFLSKAELLNVWVSALTSLANTASRGRWRHHQDRRRFCD